MDGRETEVKFYVRDLKLIELRLLKLKAQLIQPRVHEINYRYDLPNGSMRAGEQVLRLRRDNKAILTFKGPGQVIDGVFSRIELETTVGSVEAAQSILEALGYIQIMIYEKYRTVYEIDNCKIMLDELPYGEFIEIEGDNALNIRKSALQIGLKIEYAVNAGYTWIFEKYNSKKGFPYTDLTFDAFHGKKPSPDELQVRPADQ
jgi:adenylate cyclase class 2